MYGNMYRIKGDSKWHLCKWVTKLTECGLDMSICTEDRIFGHKGSDCYPDPPVSDVCPICFNFLPAFQKGLSINGRSVHSH